MALRTSQLEQYISERRCLPFDWGTSNCCHYVSGWVRSQLGYDPMSGLPVTPSAHAAKRLVKVLGGMRKAWSTRLGSPGIPVEMAQIGDIVLVPLENGNAVGICVGRGVSLVDERGFIIQVPMTAGLHAWRLGKAL